MPCAFSLKLKKTLSLLTNGTKKKHKGLERNSYAYSMLMPVRFLRIRYFIQKYIENLGDVCLSDSHTPFISG